MAAMCRVLLGRRVSLLGRHLPYFAERTRHLGEPCCLSSLRSISAGSSLTADLLVLNSLQSQIQHESHVSSLQDLLCPPKPFTIVGKPDAQEIVLHRTFGVEDIEIACVFHDQTFGDNEGEEGFGPPRSPDVPMKMVQMTIKISVGSDHPLLEIVCCQYGVRASIEQVLLRDHERKLKEAPYEGPDVSMLSEKVKAGFVQYLEARGIDNELGKFLLKYVPQKTQQKNAGWLEKVSQSLKEALNCGK